MNIYVEFVSKLPITYVLSVIFTVRFGRVVELADT